MKLATYKDGSRDGQLVVVSRDLSTAHYATGVAPTLRQVLDDWNFMAPQLQDLYVTLNQGKARHAFPFEPARCAAPLPRASLWAEALAFPGHRQTVWPGLEAGPLPLRIGGADHFLGPCDAFVLAQEAWQADVGPTVAVITDDIPQGANASRALEGVRLIVLAHAWALRAWTPAAVAQGWSAALDQPAVSFAPVAVTPDELASAWSEGRAHLKVRTALNDAPLGQIDAGRMALGFGDVLARLCCTRPLRRGSVVSAGTLAAEVSGNEKPTAGHGCIAESRAAAIARHDEAAQPYLVHGDRVSVEAAGSDGQSVFGAIEAQVVPLD